MLVMQASRMVLTKKKRTVLHESSPGLQGFPTPFKMRFPDFPGGAVVKNPPANAGDTGSSLLPGRTHMPRSS